nr:hypothetical protein [Tanacetum cinerariifolium]
MSSSTVTYTSLSSDSDLPPRVFHLMDLDEFEAPQSLEQAPPSPDYALVWKEDPEEDLADYPADGGDDDDEEEEYSEDDDEEEETFEEASEEDEDEKEEHLAPADSAALTAIDHVPSAKETEAFKTDESAATPPPPPKSPPSIEALIAEYAFAPTLSSPPPSPLSPLSSPLPRIPSPSLFLPPIHTSPTYASAPLGYRAAMVQLRAASPSTYHPLHVPSPPLLLPSADHRSDILKADMSSQKRLCLTAPASRFKAWSRSEDRITALEAFIKAQEARTTALEAHIRALHRDFSVLQR